MKKIKRIAAIVIAGCLLMGLLCASFAEETKENITDGVINNIPENTASEDIPAAETEAGIPEAGTETPAETVGEAVTVEVTPAPENGNADSVPGQANEPEEEPYAFVTPTVTDAEGYEHFISDEAPEYSMLDNGGGTIAPEVITEQIPEVTPELIAASQVEETPAPAAEQQPAVTRAWIAKKSENNGEIILKANAQPALTGKVIWQVHDKAWQEDKWEEIGSGEELTLDAQKVSSGNQIRFLLEDGTVSDIFEVKFTVEEEPAEQGNTEVEVTVEEIPTEESGSTVTAEDKPAEESTEKPSGEEPAGAEPTGEGPAGEEPAGEEPAGEEPA